MSDALPTMMPDEGFVVLVEAYCNGTISEVDFAQLQHRLRGDGEARAFYLRYMSLHCSLADYGNNVGQLWNASPAGRSQAERPCRKYRITAMIAASAMALITAALIIALSVPRPASQHSRVIARLEQTNGVVTIIGADAESRTMQNGAGIRSGETIRTESSASSTILTFSDGTRLSLVGNTSVSCTDNGQKSVIVHGGTLFASVVRQSNGKPMLLATPQNKVRVLGTKFSLTATSSETQVNVDEGRVRLTRLSDGKSVDVPAGRRVVSNVHSDLALQDNTGPPGEWSEDFEDGLPKKWTTGKFVFTNAPTGSKGGVQAVRRRDAVREYFQISTPADWANGLFTAQENSHLHFTCTMQHPGQVNIFVLTRAKTASPSFAGNYLFDREGWWPAKAGQWCTVTIPLAGFKRLAPGRIPIHDVIPFQVLFSSPITDRGLVIDRIWVTRGGPNVVETKLLN